MITGNILSKLYTSKSAAIGAAPKKEEKPKDTYAKMAGDVSVMRYQSTKESSFRGIKTETTHVLYIIKLPNEKKLRYVEMTIENKNEISINFGTPGIILDTNYCSDINFVHSELEKNLNGYKVTNGPHFETFDSRLKQGDYVALSKISEAISNTEIAADYKAIFDTINAECKSKK